MDDNYDPEKREIVHRIAVYIREACSSNQRELRD